MSRDLENYVAELKGMNDSIGGTVTCVIRNVPTGLGEPAFDKMEAGPGTRHAEYPSNERV